MIVITALFFILVVFIFLSGSIPTKNHYFYYIDSGNKVQFHGIVHFFFTYIMKWQATHIIKLFSIIFFTYSLICVKIEISVWFNICQ